MRRATDSLERTANVTPIEGFLLYAMVFSIPLQALLYVPGTHITLTKLCGALLIASLVARQIIQRRFVVRRTGLELPLLVFALSCALSLTYSVNRGGSARALVSLATYALLFYAVVTVSADEARQRNVLDVFVAAIALCGLGAIVVAFVHLLKPVSDTVVLGQDVRRISFGVADANEQALYFLFGAALLLFNGYMWNGAVRRTLSGLALSAIIVGTLLTMSRTGWICLAVLLAVRCLMMRKRVGLTLLVATGCMITVFILAYPRVMEDAERRAQAALTLSDSSVTHRLSQYVAVIEKASDKWLLGYGLGTALEVCQTIYDQHGMRMDLVPHDVPLLFFLELGAPGALAYFLIWSVAIVLLWDARKTAANAAWRDAATAYLMLLLSYGAVSLVMPFIYRSGFPILFGCAMGSVLAMRAAGCECEPGSARPPR